MLIVSRQGARRTEGRRGVAAVEFAVVLPLLMFIFVVGCDWCRVFYVANTLDDCARSGALAASGIAYLERNLTDAQRETRGKNEATKDKANLKPELKPEQVTVVTASGVVTVTVDYSFKMIAPFPGVGSTWNLTRTVKIPTQP
ncbi:MAG TPA: TadE/TadG family type IV pilus assembly protein [Planctomycetia bacterium]|nr:TadE/TadG family type IV pilus assembly protein [Planctomycetia bacterium]